MNSAEYRFLKSYPHTSERRYRVPGLTSIRFACPEMLILQSCSRATEHSSPNFTRPISRDARPVMSASASSISSICGTCYQVLSRPCELFKKERCARCSGRVVPCLACQGRGRILVSEAPLLHRECNVCRTTGYLLACDGCDGSGVQYTVNGVAFTCNGCSGSGGSLCGRCRGHLERHRFVSLCPGDNFAGQQRAHSNPANLSRRRWSRCWVN